MSDVYAVINLYLQGASRAALARPFEKIAKYWLTLSWDR